LKLWNVHNKKVAIIGVGGLGHLAVKFAVALGNEVVGISRNPNKRDEVLAWGASDYVSVNDPEALNRYKGYFDFILSTIDSQDNNWDSFLSLLRIGGILNIVGVPNGPFNLPVKQCIFKRKVITGSLIGSPSQIEEMLQFCADRNILPDVQTYPISRVDDAWVDFRAGKPRYRFVLTMD